MKMTEMYCIEEKGGKVASNLRELVEEAIEEAKLVILKRSSRSGLDPEADLAASHVASDGLVVLAQNASHFVAAFTVFLQFHY